MNCEPEPTGRQSAPLTETELRLIAEGRRKLMHMTIHIHIQIQMR